MTDIEFKFRDLTLTQCLILAELDQVLGVNEAIHVKVEQINLIHSRFTGPRRDKQWDGIKFRAVQIFSELKNEVSIEQWLQAPELIIDFIANIVDFERAKVEYDTAVRIKLEREVLAFKKREAENRAMQYAAEIKLAIKTVNLLSTQLAEETAEQKKNQNTEKMYCPGCGQLIPPYFECYC
jgi:hypothetical protein